MTIERFLQKIEQNLGFDFTKEQALVAQGLSNFIQHTDSNDILLLNGYAGSGKSSLIGSFVSAFLQDGGKIVLMAPTGRAAKVFSHYAHHSVRTIHRSIYRSSTAVGLQAEYGLAENRNPNTLFIVDEASMIGNDSRDSVGFGTGRLLDDLIHYVFSAEGCKLILVGDRAQLPPVGSAYSTALDAETLKGYGLNVASYQMTEVVRQVHTSDILSLATQVRQHIEQEQGDLHLSVTAGEVVITNGEQILEQIESSFSQHGIDETVIIVPSNKLAFLYNQAIRAQVLYMEDKLQTGDRLMVVKNNYYWTQNSKEIDFIANGDRLEVLRVRRISTMYGFEFADLSVRLTDYDKELDVKVLIDVLHQQEATLSREDQRRLYDSVLADYPDLTTNSERYKKLKQDEWYNALQVKFSYAVTAHKAQGGQWQTAIVDQGFASSVWSPIEYYRWLYTAFTRARSRLYLLRFDTLLGVKDNK